MNTNRVNELVTSMKSFSKDKYRKPELLTEMFALQQDIVELTFSSGDSPSAGLKIWDAERYLEGRNQELGNVADEELRKFKDGSRRLCNMIKAEISGARGEAKAFRSLQYLQRKNIVLKNIELSDCDFRTELDAIVITPGAITIIEVKNTAKDIFIDQNGNYYRTGEYLKWDCNIAEKMSTKENLLRKALIDKNIKDVEIQKIVVFTDNHIEVHNKYPLLRTCFVSQLAHIINESMCADLLTDEEMVMIEAAIMDAENKEAYPVGFDVEQYKKDFAILMAILEEASIQEELPEQGQEVVLVDNKILDKWYMLKSFLKSKYTGNAVAAATVTIVSTIAMNVIRKGGIFR